MQAGVGVSGRVDITIQKADGRVLTQTIENNLKADIHEQLANRIEQVGGTYSTTYQPEQMKIYAKGYSGYPTTEFSTIILPTSNRTTGAAIAPSLRVGASVELVCKIADLVFDSNTDDFDVSNRHDADNVNTHISKVELYNGGTQLLGRAIHSSDSSPGDEGYGDLGGEAGTSNVIDNSDKVTVEYIITFSGSDDVEQAYLELLAETVKDAPGASDTTPDPSWKKMKLFFTDGGTAEDEMIPLELYNTGDQSGHIEHADGSTSSIVYIGDVTSLAAYSSATVTNPIEFASVDADPDPPNKLQILGVDDMLVAEIDLTSEDFGTWTKNDNVKVHFYALVSVSGILS